MIKRLCLLICLLLAPSAQAAISVSGSNLTLNGRPWRANGINWIYPVHLTPTVLQTPEIQYLDHPTRANHQALVQGFHQMKAAGLNSVRIYVEIGQVLESPTVVRQATVVALHQILVLARRYHIYLDITGDLVWRPWRVPWFNKLSPAESWAVQAKFWRIVARTTAHSPMVFCYELNSEPQALLGHPRYLGEDGGWFFDPNVTYGMTGDQDRLARNWVQKMKAAVRSEDRQHLLTIGLFPAMGGPFGPANLSDLLDFLTIHIYPSTGAAAQAAAVVRDYASYGKPVVIGETWTLADDQATQDQFLQDVAPYTAGIFQFQSGL